MYQESFTSKLKKAREKTGFTQREIAKETGIPQSTLANYETGRTQPDIENLGILIDFYNIDANWLLSTSSKNGTINHNTDCSREKIARDADTSK